MAGDEGRALAEDFEAFSEVIATLSEEEARGLDSRWLFRAEGAVFGPIPARELLERLYDGELGPDTEIAPEHGDFRALRRYGVFQRHVERAAEAAARRAAAARVAEAATREQRSRRLRWAGAALGVVLLGSLVVYGGVRTGREWSAAAAATAREKALAAEVEALLAGVSIEPPLIPLVDDEPEAPPRAKTSPTGRRPGRRRRPLAGGRSGPLSQREVMLGVQRVFPGLVACIKGQLRRDPRTVGETIVLTFGIDNSGRARDVSFQDRFLRRSAMLGCTRDQLARARWRAYRGEVRNVEYPIRVRRPS
ncbi:MAG: hypothetical protein AAFZ18_25515 [Myxococcota bacterium]